jgi:hypothetical protein
MEERDHSQKGNVSQLLVIFINSESVIMYLLTVVTKSIYYCKSVRVLEETIDVASD